MIKKTKSKKGELSHHTHHIEGVIFEENDEGEEFEGGNFDLNKNEIIKRNNSAAAAAAKDNSENNNITSQNDKGNSKNNNSNLMQELLKFRNIEFPNNQNNNYKVSFPQ
jgi:hypothetical protein